MFWEYLPVSNSWYQCSTFVVQLSLIRRTVRSIFDEQTLAQIRTGFSHVTGRLLWLRNFVTYLGNVIWSATLVSHLFTHYGLFLLTHFCTILTMASFCSHTSVLYSLWPPSAHTPLYYTHYGVLVLTHRCSVQRAGQDGVVTPRKVIPAPVDVALNGQHVMVVFVCSVSHPDVTSCLQGRLMESFTVCTGKTYII